jgi:dTDP-4-amino-4,6-dideoxygalactose transaminase
LAQIPVTDLTAQISSIETEIMDAIQGVVASARFIGGSEVVAFEQEFAEYVGTPNAVGVGSGTDALYLGLLALGVGPGDEVITTSFTFGATAEAISRTGATPVFSDIREDDWLIDIDDVKAKVTSRTKAVIPVHLFGNTVNIHALREAVGGDVGIVEDSAQSLGADIDGAQTGSLGDIGCFSFFPSKTLGGFGDGGMVVAKSSEHADALRVLRAHGSRGGYIYEELGVNSRLDSIQAAILRVKLRHLDQWISMRRELAAAYDEGLKDNPNIRLLSNQPGHSMGYFTIAVADGKREKLVGELKSRGISTAIYYPLSLHLQPVYRSLGYVKGSLPVSELAQTSSLSLPMYPELGRENVEHILNVLNTADISS